MAKDLLSVVTKQKDISRPFFSFVQRGPWVKSYRACFDVFVILPIPQII